MIPPRRRPDRSSPAGPLRLDADLSVHVRSRPGLATVLARAAARGLTGLGVLVPVRSAAADLDAYVEAVRAAAGLTGIRIHCGLELTLFADGRTDLPQTIASRLSHVDFVRLVPQRPAHLTRSALWTAALLPVPVVVATPLPGDADLAAIGRTCARAGIAIEVTERRRSPSAAAATVLAGTGVALVAGSGARSAADVGRWDHVRAVAAALAPVPHRS